MSLLDGVDVEGGEVPSVNCPTVGFYVTPEEIFRGVSFFLKFPLLNRRYPVGLRLGNSVASIL